MEIIDIAQGTSEWNELRRHKIGASDCPVICGVDPYRTPIQLWEEKISGKKQFVSSAMRRGTELESVARDLIQKSHCAIYIPIVVQSDQYDWMIASLDGYDEERQKILEIKCPNEETFIKVAHFSDVPIHWLYQMQHQMFVTGLQECSLAVFNGTYCAEVCVKRDNVLIEEIITKEQAFYDSLINFDPPSGPLPKKEDGETMEAVLAAVELRDKIASKRNELKELEEEYEIHKEGLSFMSNDESFECKGYQVRKIVRPGNIDYAKIDILRNIDLSKFRKSPTIYWRII